ncbi:MAG: hypothetical protein BM555_06105 [Crocinitomix sp. MedPE-SWsnd]|nr:MAG: hypothetical protein BM555_06105 [Crocinitomix sp. MedPE-SWsnd]
MTGKTKFILIFLGSGIAMFLIFYFYPADIFDGKIVGPEAEAERTVSMKAFLGLDDAFNQEVDSKGFSFERKLSGWMILIILTIGMPLMFAYRGTLDKKGAKSKAAQTDSEE